MKKNNEHKVLLLISIKKFVLVAINSEKKNIYKKEFLIKNFSNELNFDLLNKFLSQNIFELEKKLEKFINNIFLIIDYKKFFSVNLSIKKKLNGEAINLDEITSLLAEAKDQCKKTLANHKIIHMKINNYMIDNSNYNLIPKGLKCDFFSLDIEFIGFPKSLIKDIELILVNYQISVSDIVNYEYLKSFIKSKEDDIFAMCDKILNGYNSNEVFLVTKNNKNEGFFERFFNFFN